MIDCRPAFPRALVRHDPLLAGIEDNPAWAAFRARNRMKRGIRQLRELAFVLGMLGIFAVVFGWLPGGGALVAQYRSVFMLLGLGWLFLLLPTWNLAAERVREEAKMPARYLDLITLSGVFRRASLDLWLCGISARDAARCIYAEERSHTWFHAFTGAAWLLAYLLVLVADAPRLASRVYAVEIAGAVAASILAVPFLLRTNQLFACARVRKYGNLWRTVSDRTGVLRRAWRDLLDIWPWIVSIVALQFVSVPIVGAVAALSSIDRAAAFSLVPLMLPLALCLAFAAGSAMIRRRLDASWTQARERVELWYDAAHLRLAEN